MGVWVAQSARARWNSLDSLFVFSWSGSAAFGGFMIAKWGFGAAFLITAVMQLLAWAILLPLVWLVPHSMPKPAAALAQPQVGPHASHLPMLQQGMMCAERAPHP